MYPDDLMTKLSASHRTTTCPRLRTKTSQGSRRVATYERLKLLQWTVGEVFRAQPMLEGADLVARIREVIERADWVDFVDGEQVRGAS